MPQDCKKAGDLLLLEAQEDCRVIAWNLVKDSLRERDSLILTAVCNPGVKGSYSLSDCRDKYKVFLLDLAMRGMFLLD